MSKLEKVKQSMLDGVEWSDLEASYAKNTIYTSYHSWIGTARVEYANIQSDIRKVRTQFESEKEVLRIAVSSREAEERRLEATQEEAAKTDQEKVVRKRELEEVTTRKKRLDEGLVALRNRGITPETVETIVATDASCLEDLRERVKTGAQHRDLKNKNEVLEESIKIKNVKQADAEAKFKDLGTQITSKVNVLDGLKAEHRSMLDAITIVTDAHKRGYTTPNIVRLFKTLEAYEVVGDPDGSISKLLKGIEVEHSILVLETIRDRLRAEKEVVVTELNHAKGVLDGYKDIVVGTIGATERKASQAMSSVRDQSLASVKQVADDAIQNMVKIESQAAARGQDIYSKWDSEVRYVQKNVIDAYQVTINSLAIYKSQTDAWGDARQASGHLEREIQEATILLSLRKDTEKIASLSPELILQLVLTLDVYLKRRLPNLSVLPTERVKKGDMGAWSYVNPLKIWALSTWIADVLATQIKEGSI